MNIAEISDGAGDPNRFGSDSDPEGEGDGDGDGDGEGVDDDDDDEYVDLGAAAAATEPAHVEVVVGSDPDDPRAPRARVPIPALPTAPRRAAAGRARPGEARGGRFERRVHAAYIRLGSALGEDGRVREGTLYAVRRRWDGGACVIEVSPAAIDDDEEGKEEEVLEQTEEQTEEEEGNEVGSSSSPEDLSRRIDESVLEVSLPTVSVSLVDDGDERLLWSLDGVALRSGSRLGVDGGGGFTELRILATQVDDQHPHTAFPVLLYHNPTRGALLDFAVTSAPPVDESDAAHPGLCVNVTPGGLHLRVHEPLIWRLRAFADKMIAGRGGGANGDGANGSSDVLSDEGRKTAAADDPSMALGLLRVSSVGVRLTFKPTPRSRPSTVGPALASVLAFLNLDRLPITVGAFVRQRARLKRSDIASQVVGHVKGEAVSQFSRCCRPSTISATWPEPWTSSEITSASWETSA